ncbi:hypothetical protein SAMN05877838_0179 [Hoeflea halophila]|uniref:Uncharacterized protein n=1 Tax=Hoeflea halophila TaxID=714899 RepID=A0A286HMC3_9HYPH|nr:hypothetical protein [Hoeflea halophila]SOE08459.1 hypothetical protein SAMN05877838_0179 [Hoeflea halophila]
MGIDATAVAWYAVICGVLSALAPSFGGRLVRVMIGAVVGIVAATVLPVIRGMAGL